MGVPLPGRCNFLPALRGVAPSARDGIDDRFGLPRARGSGPAAALSGGFISFYRSPKGSKQFLISGVTRNSAGAALGGVTVKLFKADDDTLWYTTTSDPTTGAYSFLVPSNGWTWYAYYFKAGSPDVSGITGNKLTGV